MPVDTSMYGYVPHPVNTLSQYWQPLTGQEIIGAIEARQQMDAMQTRNRLLFIEEQHREEDRRAEMARRAYLLGQGAPQDQAAAQAQTSAPPPAQNALVGGGMAPPGPLQAPVAPPPMIAGPISLPPVAAAPAPALQPPSAPPQGGGYSPEAWGRYAGQQEQLTKQRDEALATFAPLFKAIVDAGDQEAVDAMLRAAKKNPALAPMVSWIGDPDGPKETRMKITGKGESETTSTFSKEQLTAIAGKASTPEMKEAILNSPPGPYKVKSKGGKIAGFEPATKISAPLSDIGKLQHDRDTLVDEKIAKGMTAEEALKSPGVVAFNAEIKKKGAESSSGADQEKFLDIQRRSMAGKPVTADEKYFARAYRDMKTMGSQVYGKMRIEMINAIPVPVYDTTTGNIEFMMRGEITAANRANQAKGLGSRYVDAGNATKIKSKSAAFEEIENSAKQVHVALDSLNKSGSKVFSNTRLAKFASALRSERDDKAIRNLFDAEVKKTLTPAEVDYVTAVLNLRESAYSLRSLQGLGQGSDLLRAGIAALLPGATTPGPEYADSAMQKFDIEVETLKRGIPGLGASRKGVNEPVDIPGVKKPEKKAKPAAAATKAKAKPKDSEKATVVETRTLKNGEVWDKLSDGTFKKR